MTRRTVSVGALAGLLAAAGCAGPGLAPDLAATVPQDVAEAVPEDVPVVSVAEWTAELPEIEGLRAKGILDVPAIGDGGEDLGEVENLIFGPDGRVQRVVIEAGDFLDFGGRRFALPWAAVEEIEPFGSIRVAVAAEELPEHPLFGPGAEPVAEGPRAWRATDLLFDYVALEDSPAYGVVEDLVLDRDGALRAVVVTPEYQYGFGSPFAVPYFGWGFGWDPGLDTYMVPYDVDEVSLFEFPPDVLR